MKVKKFVLFSLILTLACSACVIAMTGCFTSVASDIIGVYQVDFDRSDRVVKEDYPDSKIFIKLSLSSYDDLNLTYYIDNPPDDPDYKLPLHNNGCAFSILTVENDVFYGAYQSYGAYGKSVTMYLSGGKLTVTLVSRSYDGTTNYAFTMIAYKIGNGKYDNGNNNQGGNNQGGDQTSVSHDSVCTAYRNEGYGIDNSTSASGNQTIETMAAAFKQYEQLGYRISYISKNLSTLNQEFYILMTATTESDAQNLESDLSGTYPCARRGRNVIVSIGMSGTSNFEPFYAAS